MAKLDPVQEALAVRRGQKKLADVDPTVRLETASALQKDAKLAEAARAQRTKPTVESRFRPVRPRLRVF